MPAIVATSVDTEYRLLGPVEVHSQGLAVELGGSKAAGLLALLVLSSGRAVSISALMDGLWGEEPPRTAPKMIQVLISRIRRQLGADGERLRTTAAGYQLQVATGAVDLFRFEALQQRANAQLPRDPAAASATLTEALSLWHGPALANIRTEPFAEAAAARLEELRLAAVETRIEADLEVGRHRAVVAELHELVTTYPTRERFGEQLMLALYRDGRQADALATAQQIRTNLREGLGLDPGRRLAQLELAILQQDRSLELTAERRTAATAQSPTDTATPKRRKVRARWWLATVACVVAVAILLLVTGDPRRPVRSQSGSVAVAPASLLVIDGQNASFASDTRLGGEPDLVAVGQTAAWVTNDERRTVSEINLRDFAVTATFGLPARPTALVTTGDDVWISEGFTGTVSHLFDSTGDLTAPFFPDGRHTGLVTLLGDSSHLYAGLPDGRLVALTTDNLRVTAQARLRDRVGVMAGSGSVLCAAMFRAPEVDCVQTPGLKLLATLRLPATPIGVATDGRSVWALAGTPATLYRLDLASARETTRVPIPGGASQLAVSADYLWVLYDSTGTLLRLPLAGAAPDVTLEIGRPVAAITAWGDDVIASIR